MKRFGRSTLRALSATDHHRDERQLALRAPEGERASSVSSAVVISAEIPPLHAAMYDRVTPFQSLHFAAVSSYTSAFPRPGASITRASLALVGCQELSWACSAERVAHRRSRSCSRVGVRSHILGIASSMTATA